MHVLYLYTFLKGIPNVPSRDNEQALRECPPAIPSFGGQPTSQHILLDGQRKCDNSTKNRHQRLF